MQRPEKEELIHLRFDLKMTREAIANHYGVGVGRVRRWIKALDVPRPTSAEVKKPVKKVEVEANVPTWYGLTKLDVALKVLECRVVERFGYGYYLDGKLISVDSLLKEGKKESLRSGNIDYSRYL